MTSTDTIEETAPARQWKSRAQGAGVTVESVELRSGLSLILSRFAPGQDRVFSYTEPADMFGFGFHLLDGARFRLEAAHFETRALDVWACASPRGSMSRFVLPSGGFRTVSIRFEPAVAEAYFDGGRALPGDASALFKNAHESAGAVRLKSLTPLAAERLRSMFETGYGGAARRLYLESCALELLAAQLSEYPVETPSRAAILPQHRQNAVAARDYLDRHFQNPPSVCELARVVGTNEFTLKRTFKALFGTTLFGYVSAKRMAHAQLLLRDGTPVATTARAVGYECVRSFSAAFHRQTGQRPSSVRRAARGISPDRR